MVHWGESFWGEGNRGLEVLSSNVKNGAIAIEEFQRFLTESVQCESIYCKSLSRLQSQLFKTQYVGTFTPIWHLIRDLFDKISTTHLSAVNSYQDLLRDVHNYLDLYQKKVKTHIQKDGDIIRSADMISLLHNALNTVNKSKEQYHSIGVDNERAKRVGNHVVHGLSMSSLQDNNSTSLAQSAINSIASRQLERSEKKHRQAQEDYKSTIEKYNKIRTDFEKCFFDACTKFQDFEIDHIEKMLAYSLNYCDILHRNSEQIRMAQSDFNDKLKSFTGSDLLDAFVEQKKTGIDRPAVLQFEDVDHLKPPTQLVNSSGTDLSSGQDDLNLFDQPDPNVPAFQAHFSVSAPTIQPNDHRRGLSSNLPSNQPSHNAAGSPSSSVSPTTMSPMASNNLTSRIPEINNSNDQTSNPFDLKIKRPKFPGFFGAVRKDRKEKKPEKKSAITSKSQKPFQTQSSRDTSHDVNLQNSNYESHDFMMINDKNDDSPHSSLNMNKNDYLTTDPYAQSNDINYLQSPGLDLLSPTKSSSSSDSTDDDDDDDNMMLKINVKINPKSDVSNDTVGDDHTKIMNAMRLIDRNIGNFATTSRGPISKTSDINQSASTDQVVHRIPPPVPSRSSITIPNSITVDYFDQTNMFPSPDEFDRSPSKTIDNTSTNQEHLSITSSSTRESKHSTSVSSIDDDTEVANSFPHGNSTNKMISSPSSQTPAVEQSNQQRSILTPVHQSIAAMTLGFRNSPIISNEQGVSPLTIGATDQIPLAIALQETIHVLMSGNNSENWKSRIVGEMLISFPASMVNLLVDPIRLANILQFQLKNLDHIENIMTHSSSITQNESNYSFDMTELHNILRDLREKTPLSRFFNLNVLTYEVKHPDSSIIPIEITSQWTRTFDTISVKINYRFNSSVLPGSLRLNNDAVIFYTIITDGQEIKESSPVAEWSFNEHKLWWKVPYITDGTGSLSATVTTVQMDTVENENDEQEQPLTTSSIVNASFVGENVLFSALDFDLTCRGYRISLLKKKILTGKYQSEPDQSGPLQFFKRPALSSSPIAQ